MSQAVCKKMRDALLSNTVLHHLDLLDTSVQTICLRPCCHTAIFESIAAADHRLEVRNFLSFFPRLLFLDVQSRESICNQDTGVRPKSVVIEDEMLKGHVRREEGDQGSLGVQTEGIIVEIDGVQFR